MMDRVRGSMLYPECSRLQSTCMLYLLDVCSPPCVHGLQSFQVIHDVRDLEPTSVVSHLLPFVLLFKRVRVDAEDSGSICHPDCLGMLIRGSLR